MVDVHIQSEKLGAGPNTEFCKSKKKVQPVFLFPPHPQTTSPRAKPEEEKEDEMESRAFHRFSQVPLRHIVTSLILFYHPEHKTHTLNMHTHTPFGCQGTPQQSITTGAQKGRGGLDEWLHGSKEGRSESETSTDVPSALHNALE